MKNQKSEIATLIVLLTMFVVFSIIIIFFTKDLVQLLEFGDSLVLAAIGFVLGDLKNK